MSTSKNQSLLARMRFARAGLTHAVATEKSLKFQVATPVYKKWWLWTIVGVVAQRGKQLFNTAIELLADHLHPETHASIRIVKDCAAGAVLVAVITAVAVGASLAMHLVTHL